MDIALIVFDMAGTTVHDDDAVNHALRGALAGVADRERFLLTAERGEELRLILVRRPGSGRN